MTETITIHSNDDLKQLKVHVNNSSGGNNRRMRNYHSGMYYNTQMPGEKSRSPSAVKHPFMVCGSKKIKKRQQSLNSTRVFSGSQVSQKRTISVGSVRSYEKNTSLGTIDEPVGLYPIDKTKTFYNDEIDPLTHAAQGDLIKDLFRQNKLMEEQIVVLKRQLTHGSCRNKNLSDRV